jgi:hypothetical protein
MHAAAVAGAATAVFITAAGTEVRGRNARQRWSPANSFRGALAACDCAAAIAAPNYVAAPGTPPRGL